MDLMAVDLRLKRRNENVHSSRIDETSRYGGPLNTT